MSKYVDHFSNKPNRAMLDEDRRETRRGIVNKKMAHKRFEVEVRLAKAWERAVGMLPNEVSSKAYR